jgi:hypothetical protein
MATIVTRAGKGAPLTHTEVDANFNNLNTDKLESGDVSTVALSGSYNDLSDKPTLGTAAAADTTDFVAQTATTGAAVIPTGTEAQRPTPAAGQLRFNTDAASFEGYDGTEWGSIGGGATSDAIYENSATIAENITIVAGRNGMSTGPITINAGVTVTVSTGARYVVL